MQAYILSIFLAFQAFVYDLPVVVDNDAFLVSKNVQDLSIRKNPRLIAPVVDASASLAVDRQSGTILFSKNAYKKVQIASITKLMTALVVRENAALDELVTISHDAASVEGSKVQFQVGDKVAVRDVLAGLLIESGNDAAISLAEHVGKGNVRNFVQLMNDRLEDEGFYATHFSNPMGFDHANNYSTAYEVYKMADLVLQDPFLASLIAKRTLTIESSLGNTYTLVNTNKVLGGYLDIRGLKTGTTDQAGASLVATSHKDQRQIIGVVLESPRRFSEMKILLDWCYRAYDF